MGYNSLVITSDSLQVMSAAAPGRGAVGLINRASAMGIVNVRYLLNDSKPLVSLVDMTVFG